MAEVDVRVGGRNYELACRDGDEDRLRMLAAIVDTKTTDLSRTMGGLNEVRQLLFAALLLADELCEAAARAVPPPAALADPAGEAAALAIEDLAERVEELAARLEKGAATA